MDLFKLRKFKRAHKPANPESSSEDKSIPLPEEPKNQNGDGLGKSVNDAEAEAEDDDDDFIMDEVKRRLKELRRNSFMVLIPEESCQGEGEEEEDDDEEDETTSYHDWRDVEAEARQLWSGFLAVYDKYCERMLFFDRLSAQLLNEVGTHVALTPSPRSKKLSSQLRCLSLKRIEKPEGEETEHLQQAPVNEPYQDLETAYVAQLCLTWEALHCQYTQLSRKISSQPENNTNIPTTSYNHSAQQFQQFQVLLQRFIENEPFEHGLRPQIYCRTRNSLPKLLQVPYVEGSDKRESKEEEEEESDLVVHAPDLIKIIEDSILTFHTFVKRDKKKAGGVRSLFAAQNQTATPLQQIQASLDKIEMKLKEHRKKRGKKNKKSWPIAEEEVEVLLGLVDVRVLSRVLRMTKMTKEQLFWCQEKMKKLYFSSDGKLHRDSSPIFFPAC